MPPQEQQPSNPSSSSDSLPPPNPEYNFIFNGEQKPKKRLNISLPLVSKLPKPAAYALLLAVALIIIIPVASAIFSKTPNSQQLANSAAKAQEIIRVSDLVEQQTNDANTKGLATTTSASLSSDQEELKAYLASHKNKVKTKDLAGYLNKNTDSELDTAAQNNNLSAVYAAYLKKQLADYKSYLQQIYKDSPKKAQVILKEAFTSTSVLLSAPAIASSASS